MTDGASVRRRRCSKSASPKARRPARHAEGAPAGAAGSLLLVHGGDQRAARGGGERVGGHAHARDLDGQRPRPCSVRSNSSLKPLRLGGAAGEHDGQRPVGAAAASRPRTSAAAARPPASPPGPRSRCAAPSRTCPWGPRLRSRPSSLRTFTRVACSFTTAPDRLVDVVAALGDAEHDARGSTSRRGWRCTCRRRRRSPMPVKFSSSSSEKITARPSLMATAL